MIKMACQLTAHPHYIPSRLQKKAVTLRPTACALINLPSVLINLTRASTADTENCLQ
jgi:hypothetical protein